MHQYSLAIAAAVAVFSLARPAFPCTVAGSVSYLELGTEASPMRSVDGSFVTPIDASYQGPDFVVLDSEGNELSGTTGTLGNDLATWVPDEPLAAGRYVVEGRDWEETTTGVLEVGASVPDQLTIDKVDLGWRESKSRAKNCCGKVPDCFEDDCPGGPDCDICWSQGYEYSPRLTFVVSAEISAHAVMARFEGGTESVFAFPLDEEPLSVRLVGTPHSDGPLCVELTVIDAMSEPVADPVVSCHELSEFPELEPRDIDNTSIMSQCEQEPDDPADPQWVAYTKENKDAPGASGGGCSTAHATPSWLLLFALGFLRRRR